MVNADIAGANICPRKQRSLDMLADDLHINHALLGLINGDLKRENLKPRVFGHLFWEGYMDKCTPSIYQTLFNRV